MDGLDSADVQADLADADLAPRLAGRRGRGAVPVQHLDELQAAGPDWRRVARCDHGDPSERCPAPDRLEPGYLARVVEEHAVEADVSAVEVDRLVDVADADTDVVDPHEGRHAASTGCASRPVSTRISRIRRRLSSSVTGRRGGRTSPPG